MNCVTLLALAALTAAGGSPAEPIQSVTVGENAELRVNGRPFLPIMLWLQSEARIPDGLAIAANTFAGDGGGSLKGKAYLDALAARGLFGVIHFDANAVGHPALLGWIHGDEPDLHRQVSDAEVVPGPGLVLNASTPLWRLVDGNASSWSVLDPLEGAEVTIRVKAPVTVRALAVSATVSENLSVAKEVAFFGDGRELLRTTLENRRGAQRFALPEAATFRELSLKVLSTYPGREKWGSLGEVEAFDDAGKNVLLSPPRYVPRARPEEVAAEYRRIKAADPRRPVFVTFTANFMRESTIYDAATKQQLYPEYVKSCDVAGFDIYPIFGWNKPEWLYRVADGVSELRAIAGPKRPVYAWIETNKGSRWVSPERQIDVTPADTRAEVWMALIRGASGIGYFTHRWVPDYKQFAPEGEMVTALRVLNQRITRLAPALLAPAAPEKVEMSLTGGLGCHVKATRLDGVLYLFAQNMDMKRQPGEATLRVPGLKAGTRIEVVDENRFLTAADGFFTDRFEPLAEHVYRIAR
ncbi:MAG: hypothetical protein QHJ73_04385 [Armatimonadota bacterium]|nr:hypothetical protein [Armatimonadota bacterium]